MIYSLSENFVKSVGQFQDKIAIESKIANRYETLTYRQLGDRVKSLAYFISTLGIKKSDKVAIILENRPEWPIAFFALSYIGAVAVPLDPQLPERDIKDILADSGARLAFVSKRNQTSYGFLEGQIAVITIEEIKEVPPPEEFKKADIDPDDLMVILYTSGTTDAPKGVMLTHKNLCANFNSVESVKLFSYRDVVLSILPLYHSYPLMTTLIVPVLLGAKVVYVASDWPEKLVDYLKEARVSIFFGVPQIFYMMHNRMMKRLKEVSALSRLYIRLVTNLHLARILLPRLKNAFGKDLRFFACGGAKLDKTIAGDFLRLGFKILEGYGLTETAPIVSFNPLRRPKIGSVGIALPHVRLKIVNKRMDGTGEIAIQGPNVMKGYYKNETKTREVIKDGWLLSGDIGYIDKQGYLYITGRLKEVIVLSSGKNIYPEEIERHYSITPYVKEMCVMGVLKQKGKGRIEYLYAVVVPDLEFFKRRGEMNIRVVIKNVFENLSKDLPSYKHVMGFTVTQDSLPRTVLGKIKRYEVEKKFMPLILKEQRGEEEKIMPEEKGLFESGITRQLIDCIKDTLNIKTPVRLHDSIELDLGVDSLGRVELMLAVERCFNIDIPEEMIAGEIFTVKDLLLKVEELIKEEPQREKGHEERPILWPEILKQPLPFEFQKKILLYPGWIDYIFTFLVQGSIKIFFRIFYNLKIEGAQRIPERGPYILCVNHTSFLDGFIVAAGVPLRTELHLFFIGFRRYFIAPIVRNLVRRARVIPIDATQIVEAMQASCFILTHNKALCIFPEGERSIDGGVKEFRKGIGIISRELNVPLIPVLVKGAFEAWPRAQRFPRLHPIEIKFGDPLSPDILIQKGMRVGASDEYEAISLSIREELIRLRCQER